jgi:WD40 repeat protein
MTTPTTPFYVTGGTLRPDAPSYVERQADRDLYDGLTAGEFCYVLHSRQMGKSSLMAHTTLRLRADGLAVANLDLTRLGQNLTVEQWYEGLLGHTGRQLDLEDELEANWEEHERLSPLQRWLTALQGVVLKQIPGRLVIAIDEIDAVRSLPFSTDEFFAAIRDCYNRRSQDPEFARLIFCLLGVATPSDLIQDTRTTPFNIGKRIELTDFTAAEAAPLAQGLGRDERTGRVLLERVLYWTGGHPYLTQRLCQAVAADPAVMNPGGVDRHCEALFLSSSAQEKDDNLLFVRERLLNNEVDLAGLLDLYGQVRSGKQVALDDTSQLVSLLRLSGITRVEQGRLRVRNRIYERVFDRAWVTNHMPDAELRRQQAAYRRGLLRATTVSGLVVAVIAGLAFSTARLAGDRKTALIQSRRLLYAAQMNLAQQAWEASDIDRARALVEAQRPKPGQEDLRGFEWRYLWRLCQHQSLRRTLVDLRHENSRFSMSADGRRLAVWGGDGAIRLLELPGGRQTALLRDPKRFDGAALSPDGRLLVGWAGDHTMRLWKRTASGALIRLPAPQDRINWLVFSPNGRLMATTNVDGSIRLWDARTLRPTAWLRGHTKEVWSLAFSPDGRTLASGGRDRTVRLWDLRSRREMGVLRGHQGEVFGLTFCQGGRLLASCGAGDAIVRLWDITARKGVGSLRGHTGPVFAMTVSPDGKLLATGSLDTTVRLWDLASRREVALLQGHNWLAESLAFDPNGRLLASGGGEGTLRLWKVATHQPIATLRGHKGEVFQVAFLPDGQSLVSSSLDGTVKLWDADVPMTTDLLRGNHGGVNSVAISSDGKLLASGGWDRTVRLWDLPRQREIATFLGHTQVVRCVAFSPDGKLLASGGDDTSVRLWDLAAHRGIAIPGADQAKVRNFYGVGAVAFSPDGKLLASGGVDQQIHLRQAASGRPIVVLPGHQGIISALAFSPNGRLLASGTRNHLVKLWDVVTRREIVTLRGHSEPVRRVAFSPDGKLLASGSNDATVKLWDVATHQCLGTLVGHAYKVSGLAFSPDGKELATSSEEGTVKLWNLAMQQEVGTPSGHLGSFDSATFSPDGNTLAAGNADHLVRLWHAPTFAETDAPITPGAHSPRSVTP